MKAKLQDPELLEMYKLARRNMGVAAGEEMLGNARCWCRRWIACSES